VSDATAGGPLLSETGSDPAEPCAGPSEASDELIACTICDALHVVRDVPDRGRLKCRRCGETLLSDPGTAIDILLASSIAVSILLVSAVFFPFLKISASGLNSAASLLDTALAFSEGITAPLTYALFLVIVIIPVFRAVLLVYALLPIRLGRKILPDGRQAFHFACALRPWSMAEVFIIGVIVALVKLGSVASVTLGPAFWELTIIVLIVIIEAAGLNEKTVWRTIEQHSTS
jgi:paraquat-inducible protein A